MTRRVMRLASSFCMFALVVFGLSIPALHAQDGESMDLSKQMEALREAVLQDKKDAKEAKFSPKDIEKMQEFAQKPEIKKIIEEIYGNMRSGHQNQAYRLNTTPGRNGIYSNPVLQEYVNQLGQSLIPADTMSLYTFRIIYDPRPDSYALSTGSIYITTGMLSSLGNEAQLAYVLGHEIAHVERNHFYEEVRGQILEQALEIEKERSAKKKGAILGAIAGGVGALAGGISGGANDALNFGMAAAGAAFLGYNIVNAFQNKAKATVWESVKERDADEFALKRALEKNYDVREAPKLLIAMEQTITRDPRAGFGFHGSKNNIADRKQHVQMVLDGTLKQELQAKAQGSLIGSSPNFSLLMAALKRDNGVLALDYDLFDIAKKNLEEAETIRSSDPTTQYYLGKVYRLTARTPEEKQKAQSHILQAIRYDAERSFYADPHLELALTMIRENDAKLYPEIQKELKTYVQLYQRNNAGSLPENMNIIYDYLSMSGESSWMVPRVVNVATPVGPKQ